MRWLLCCALLCCVLFPSESWAEQGPGHSFLPRVGWKDMQHRFRGWWQPTTPTTLSTRKHRPSHSKPIPPTSDVLFGTHRRAFSRSSSGTFFFVLGMPAAIVADIIALVGCSIALGKGDPDTMWWWGLAGVIMTSLGYVLMQSIAVDADTGGGNPLYGGILFSMALNIPFIAFSAFTMAMGANPKVAGYLGIGMGVICTLGPILATAPSIGGASISMLSTSLVGLSVLIMGFAALGDWGKVRSRTFFRKIAVAPLVMPTQDGGLATGMAVSGRF